MKRCKYPKFYLLDSEKLHWGPTSYHNIVVAKSPLTDGISMVFPIRDGKILRNACWHEETIINWVKQGKAREIDKYEAALL